MKAGKWFSVINAVDCLLSIVVYSFILQSYLTTNDSIAEQKTLYIIQELKELFVFHDLFYGILIMYIFSEWLAMWFLMYVQKDADVDELLFDLENPALMSSQGDNNIFRFKKQ